MSVFDEARKRHGIKVAEKTETTDTKEKQTTKKTNAKETTKEKSIFDQARERHGISTTPKANKVDATEKKTDTLKLASKNRKRSDYSPIQTTPVVESKTVSKPITKSSDNGLTTQGLRNKAERESATEYVPTESVRRENQWFDNFLSGTGKQVLGSYEKAIASAGKSQVDRSVDRYNGENPTWKQEEAKYGNGSATGDKGTSYVPTNKAVELDNEVKQERIADLGTRRENYVDLSNKGTETFMEGYQQYEQAKTGNGLVDFAIDAGSQMIQMGTDMALGTFTGTALIPMFTRVFGQGTIMAESRGKSEADAEKYGLVMGALETATEMMWSMGKILKGQYGEGVMSEDKVKALADWIAAKVFNNNEMANVLLTSGISASTEGIEELVSDVFQPMLDKIFFGENGYEGEGGFQRWLADSMRDFALGMATSGILGAGGTISEMGNVRDVQNTLSQDMTNRGDTTDNMAVAQALSKLTKGIDITEDEAQSIASNPQAMSIVQETYNREVPAETNAVQSINRLETNKDTVKQYASKAESKAEQIALEESYDENQDPIKYIKGMSSFINVGKTGDMSKAYDDGTLNDAQKAIAIKIGENYAEQLRLRRSSEWNDSQSSRSEVSAMEGEAGRTEAIRQLRQARDTQAIKVEISNEIKSSQLLDLGTDDIVYEATDNYTPSMQNAVKKGEAVGVTVRFFGGGYVRTGVGSHRAFIKGNETWVRFDDPNFTSDQIVDHELYHNVISNKQVRNQAIIKVKDAIGEEKFNSELEAYRSALDGMNYSDDELIDEMLCDFKAGMNIFQGSVTTYAVKNEVVVQKAKSALKNIETNKAPPTEEINFSSVADAIDTLSEEMIKPAELVGNTYKFSNVTEITKFPKGKSLYDATVRETRNALITMMNVSNKDKAAELTTRYNRFFDDMSKIMTEAGYKFQLIGLQDVDNAKIYVSRDSNGKPKEYILSCRVKNGEYPINVDFTTICKKRQAMSRIFEKLANSNEVLTEGQLFQVNDILRKNGYETACLGCFVESKRYNLFTMADGFITDWNKAVLKLNPNAEYFNFGDSNADFDNIDYAAIEDDLSRYNINKGKLPSGATKEWKIDKLSKSGTEYQKLLKLEDFVTPEGIKNMRRFSPELLMIFLSNAASPKPITGFTPYNSEMGLIINMKKEDGTSQLLKDVKRLKKKDVEKFNEKLYAIGGARTQSFSDFMIAYVYDYMQMIADMSIRNMPAHAYTKEIAFAKIFGLTGMKINMSVMFDIDTNIPTFNGKRSHYAGLTFVESSRGKETNNGKRGSWEYVVGDKERSDRIYNDAYKNAIEDGKDESEAQKIASNARPFVQSINLSEAIKLQNTPGYSKNVGIIGVGYSKYHIFKMLNDKNFGYIIPYHSSGLPGFVSLATHLDMAEDYQNVQGTLKIKSGSAKNYPFKQRLKELGSARAVFEEFNRLLDDGTYTMKTVTYKKDTADFDTYEDVAETKDPRQTAENYLVYCIEKGLIPKFYEFAGHENYYKLSIFDFGMYDYRTGEYSPQLAVRSNYPGPKGSIIEVDNLDGSLNLSTLKRILFGYMNEENMQRERENELFPETLNEIKNELGIKANFSTVVDSEGNKLTEAQIDRFKNSKVRDEDGNLQLVYHGSTHRRFNKFKPKGPLGKNVGFNWATPEWELADAFAGGDDARYYDGNYGTLLEGYLNIENPLDIGEISTDKDSAFERVANLIGVSMDEFLSYSDGYYLWEYTGSKPFMKKVLSLGYDGVKATEDGITTYGFAKSNQFKESTNENPTDNDDIRFSTRIDEKYLELAKDPQKNDKELRQMIDGYAKSKGYNYRGYHGTSSAGFVKFNAHRAGRTRFGEFGGIGDFNNIVMFTTSLRDAGSYGGTNGTIFNPNEKQIDKEVTGGNYRLGKYLRFNTEEDRENFAKEHPKYKDYIPASMINEVALKEDWLDDWETYSERFNDAVDLAEEIEKAYYWYESRYTHSVSAEEFLKNIDDMSINDIRRAMMYIDREVSFYPDNLEDDTHELWKEAAEYMLEEYSRDDDLSNLYFEVAVKPGETVTTKNINKIHNRVYDCYLKIENPKIVEFYNQVNDFNGAFYRMVADFKKSDYDGFIAKNLRVGAYKKPGDVIIVKESNQIALANPVIYDDNGNIIPLSQRFNSSNEDIRYSTVPGETVYNDRVLLSDARLQRMIREYGSTSNDSYSKAYITYMKPKDFIRLTVSGADSRLRIEKESRPLNEEELRNEPQHIFLIINNDGEVEGHEGRHRIVALGNEGIKDVPVVIINYDNKYSKVPITDGMLLWNQFQKGLERDSVFVNNLDVIKPQNYESLKQKYTVPNDIDIIDNNLFGTRSLSYSTVPQGLAELQKENRQLQAKVDYLTQQTQKSKEAFLNENDVKKLANKLLKDHNSKADKEDIVKRLSALGRLTLKSQISYDELEEKASEIAYDIVSNASVLVDDPYIDTVKAVKNYVKDMKIYFVGDVNRYEDIKKHLNVLKNSGIDITTKWSELTELFGEEYFSSEVDNPADMIEVISEIVSTPSRQYENPYANETYGFSFAEAQQYATNYILDAMLPTPIMNPIDMNDYQAMEMREGKTMVDEYEDEIQRKENQVSRLKGQIKETKRESGQLERKLQRAEDKIEKVQAQGEQKLKEAKYQARWREAEQKFFAELDKSKMREGYENALKKVRQQRDAERRKRIEDITGIRKATKERELRKRIRKHCKDLTNTLFYGTDKKHIPDELIAAVSDVLKAINLESVDPYTKKSEAFRELRKAIEEANEKRPLVLDERVFDEKDGHLKALINMKDKPIDAMNFDELTMVWETLKATEAAVRSYNKTFSRFRYESLKELAEAIKEFNQNKDKPYTFGKGSVQRLLTLDMMTPEAYFHRLGPIGDELFRALRDGQDKYVRIVNAAKTFSSKAIEESNINLEKLRKDYVTVILGGQRVTINKMQAMDIYNLVSRGKQAIEHMTYAGGIEIVSHKGHRQVTKVIPGVTEEELMKALLDAKLQPNEIAFAEALSNYMSTDLAKEGNETSKTVYGYSKFLEEKYWPMRVSAYDQDSDTETKKTFKATHPGNKGFTINPVKKSKKYLKIDDGFEVYSNHVSDMATYAAYLEPTLDLTRLLNWTFRDDSGEKKGRMKPLLDNVFGDGGYNYWHKLLQDITMGIQAEQEYMSGWFVANYKAASVGLNLRVTLQQPTSILRAMGMINPKYFVKRNNAQMLKGWEKAKKYSPIAQWKDWGYFDINTGKSIQDILSGGTTKLSKAKEISMMPASVADSITWGYLWNTCEKEVRAKYVEDEEKTKDLTPEEKEELFYKKVAERFNEVIDHTQVVDGILQRSQIMRNGSGLNRMATSFMGEPTKMYNMLMSAIYDFQHGNKKNLAPTILGLTLAGVVNAAVQSLVDALRGDDKDKDYWEKFLNNFFGFTGEEETYDEYIKAFLNGNLESAFNILQNVPYIKDVLSIIQGYSVDRMDMSTISNVVDAFGGFVRAFNGSGKNSVTLASINLVSEIARLFGIPAANVKRDILSVLTTYGIESGNYIFQYELDKTLYNINNSGVKGDVYNILYNAMLNDKKAYNYIYNDVIKNGFKEENIKSAMDDRKKKNISVKDKNKYLEVENKVISNNVYKKVPESQRDDQLQTYKSLVAGVENNDTVRMQKILDEGMKVGLSADEFILYKLAVIAADLENTEVDEDGKPKSNGSYDADEKRKALEMLKLSEKEKDFLWYTYEGYTKTKR